MLQEATTAVWDLNQTTAGPNSSQKLFMLLLLVACIAASKKLIRVWRAQPPFRQLRESHRSQYASLLQSLPASLKQWIVLVCLALGILASISVVDACSGMLSNRGAGILVIVFLVRDFSIFFTMALLAILFIFLIRWHILRRIQIHREPE
jgi:hypothetical protein